MFASPAAAAAAAAVVAAAAAAAVVAASAAAAAATGVLLMRLLPGSLQYREVPAALLRGWMLGKNNWTEGVTQATPHGFLWTPSPAPAHTVAAVGMIGLAFAAAEDAAGRVRLVRNMECWCMKQLYSLTGGEIADGTSYIVGAGPRWPKRPHHRQASCPADGSPCTVTTALMSSLPNPRQLTGALVAGPHADDGFSDVRSNNSPPYMGCCSSAVAAAPAAAAGPGAGALVAGPDAYDGFRDVRSNAAQLSVGLDGNVFLSGLLAGLLDRNVKPAECHGGRGFFQNMFLSYAP
uniref:cellulase n=1 Tax=Tetradesmus obliquus TaxID=3088 RepID=A0A383W5M1_TETOB|eukprot:jgi/Sobl393_1/12421/SZX72928.1